MKKILLAFVLLLAPFAAALAQEEKVLKAEDFPKVSIFNKKLIPNIKEYTEIYMPIIQNSTVKVARPRLILLP